MNLLLVQTAFLGDAILSTPVIEALHRTYPSAKLSVLTTPLAAQLIERDPLVSEVIPFDKRGEFRGVGGMSRFAGQLRGRGFDAVYSLHRSFRTSLLLWLAGIPERIGFSDAVGSWLYSRRVRRGKLPHAVLRHLAILPELESASLDSPLRLFAPDVEDVRAEIRESLTSKEENVVLVPGSVWATKRWNWKGYREVAEQLLEEGKNVLVLGAPNEREIAERVSNGLPVRNLAGETTLPEMMYLVKNAQLMICNDSMALHMASAFQIPTVAVFCATTPGFGFGPWKNRAVVVEKSGLHCRPCRRHGSKRCPTGTEACMKGVSASEVLLEARQLVGRSFE